MGWKNIPFVFRNCASCTPKTEYPINVIEYVDDDTIIGTIDEDRLSTVQRLALDAVYN